MYFLSQIKRQYIAYIKASEMSAGGFAGDELTAGAPNITDGQEDFSQDAISRMSSSEILEELKERLDIVKAGEGIVRTRAEVLIRFCKKVKNNEIHGYSTEDKDYQILIEMVMRAVEEYKLLTVEANEIDTEIHSELARISTNIGSEIENPEENVVQENLDRTQQEYTVEGNDILRSQKDAIDQEIRNTFFTQILGEDVTDNDLSSYLDHEKIQKLIRRHEEGFEYGYDISKIIEKFEEIEAIETGTLQEMGESLDYSTALCQEVLRDMNIIARDVQAMEGDTTFGETRLEVTHEAYKKLLEDPEVKEILTNRDGSIPLFEDLGMDHINLLKNKGINLTGLFLVNPSGENFEGGLLETGKTYIVNFSANEDFNNNMDFSFIDSSAGQLEIDGQLVRFNQTGTKGAGYYDENGIQVLLQDGSEVKIISMQREVTPDAIVSRDEAIGDRLEDLANLTTQERSFVEAVYRNPGDTFNGEKLPGGLAGAIIAMLLNFLDGANFQYNAEKGIWENIPEGGGSGSPLTNGEVVSAYLGSMELGSLSAEFESSSQGSYAYNPNDNGHGPSYGTYQMNSEVGVYRGFIQKYGIAEGRQGWNAAIEKYGIEEFQKMEHQHIKENNYDPMIARITIPNKENFSIAMQNVIWSIGVQHGPGHSGILAIINNSGVVPGDKKSEANLINALYDKRGRVYPAGISSRYNRERSNALAMLSAVNAVNMYNQGIGEIPGGIRSFPVERSASVTTLCSRTARRNLGTLGLTDVNGGSSAKAAFEKYPSERISDFPPAGESEAKVADLFLDASSENRQYGHRVAAFQQDGHWYVLDPYYLIGRSEGERQNPIPAEQYINYMQSKLGKRIWGAAYFS